MKIYQENAEYELLPVIASIQKDLGSWENWYCLHIETPYLSQHPQCAAIEGEVRSMLEVYIDQKEASAYFCGHNEVFVFWKHYSDVMVNEVGRQISNYIAERAQNVSAFNVYNLCVDGDKLVQNALHPTIAAESGKTNVVVNAPCMPELEETCQKISAPRVLLVEDDAVTRWLVRSALREECFLAVAGTVANGIESYRSFRPDIVLLDINLPDGHGGEVLDVIMQDDPGAHVVMLSGQDSLENISLLMSKGARGFVAKPFRKEKLLSYIREKTG